MEDGAECTGPSLAFVPLRGTKDCAQDDKPKGAKDDLLQLQTSRSPDWQDEVSVFRIGFDTAKPEVLAAVRLIESH
jgi:hypothetical protein